MPWKPTPITRHAASIRPGVKRPSASAQGYGAEWRRIRAKHIKANPDCAWCGDEGQHVDHILPLNKGGTHDVGNLQTLCIRCHSIKTAKFDGGFGNRRKRK